MCYTWILFDGKNALVGVPISTIRSKLECKSSQRLATISMKEKGESILLRYYLHVCIVIGLLMHVFILFNNEIGKKGGKVQMSTNIYRQSS